MLSEQLYIDDNYKSDSNSSNFYKSPVHNDQIKSSAKQILDRADFELENNYSEKIKYRVVNRVEASTRSNCCCQPFSNFFQIIQTLSQAINLKLNRVHYILLLLIFFLIAVRFQAFVYRSLFPFRPTRKEADDYFLSNFHSRLKIESQFSQNTIYRNLTNNTHHIIDQRDETSEQTFKIYTDELSKFRQELDEIYMEKGIPYKSCPRVPRNLKGFLNSTLVLKHANLTSLIEFYGTALETTTKRARRNAKKTTEKYVNKMIDRNKTREFWELWNSNDMQLLNVSSDYYANDGLRIQPGGYWKPKGCVSNFKIAIIIPYRDRLPHLKVLLYYLHLILQRQMHEYRIFVVEPNNPVDVRFNKGRVMNAAYLEALKTDEQIDCFIFHDVDLVPEDDRILYSCPSNPRHLSAAIDKFNYILPYDYLVGGVFAISREHYKLINGYSNNYWGWGAEDDDLAVRIKANKLRIMRAPSKFSRFKMMRHKAQELNPNRGLLLKKAKKRHNKDGVNSVVYEVIQKTLYSGFTHILVDIGKFGK